MFVWEGEDPQTSVRFYITVGKYVLLLGSETWVETTRILTEMGSIHNQAALRISGRMPQRPHNGRWFYTQIWETLADAGLEMIVIYFTRLRNNASQ